MKKITKIIAVSLMCLALAGCSQTATSNSGTDHAISRKSKTIATGTAISENNSWKEPIQATTVLVQPDTLPTTGMGNKKIHLSHSEIKKFSSLLDNLSQIPKIDSEEEAEESMGQFIQFDFSLNDDTRESVIIRNPYITYHGTTYKDLDLSEKFNIFANRIILKKTVSYQCYHGSISLCIPDDWSHKIEKYKKTKEEESFGITFWKDSSKKKKISVQYTKWFGVCGTGLKTKKLKINNMDGEGGYYDGKPYWDYILFHKQFKNYFTVLNFCDSETWWKQNGGQVMEILDTLILKENK